MEAIDKLDKSTLIFDTDNDFKSSLLDQPDSIIYTIVCCDKQTVLELNGLCEKDDKFSIVHLVDTSKEHVVYETKKLVYYWYDVKEADLKHIVKHML